MKNDENKIEKLIDDLAISVSKGFDHQNERFDKLESRFDNLEKDNVWIKDILEKQTTTLERLDQERIFTFNYIKRLEAEVNKIKKQLKIA
jgi:vacuolar-type H+-ATPase subunit I/STV1